jgi:hypothetical protein
MPSTYTPIATTTLGSAAASYTFSSIAGTYTDLVLIVQGRSTRTADEYSALQLRFNSDTGSNYSFTCLLGSGLTAASERGSNQTSMRVSRFDTSVSSNTSMGTSIVQIQNYSNSTTNKTTISRGSQAIEFFEVNAFASLWRNTAAITSITLLTDTGENFAAGSTFTLYGIQAA